MKPIGEDDINQMLAGMKHDAPDSADAFDQILKRIDTPSQRVKYLQLRNAGIAMLLVVAINIVIIGTSGKRTNTVASQQQEQAGYLQPYNLNLY